MEVNSILNSGRYADLKRMFDYDESKPSLRTNYVIKCCSLLKTLVKDDTLWKKFEKPNYPLHPIRLRYTISGKILKAIITIHEKHMKAFLGLFKQKYVRIFSFSKSGNRIKVVVLEEIGKIPPQTIDDLRPRLPGLQIISTSITDEGTALSARSKEIPPTSARESVGDGLCRSPPRKSPKISLPPARSETEIPSIREEIFQISGTLPPRPIVEIPDQEHVSTSRNYSEQLLAQIVQEEISIQQAIEAIEEIPSIHPMTEYELITILDDEQSISHRRRYDPNFIEVVEEETTEMIPGASCITKSRTTTLDSQKTDKVEETVDEVRKYLRESGIGVEGHEHIKTMEELQRVLNEEFSPRSHNIATVQPPPRLVSPPSLSTVVVADIHHLPRHLRSPEQQDERVAETSSLQVQVEVHAPPRSINYDEIIAVMESDQIPTPQAVEERPHDNFDLIVEQVRAVERDVQERPFNHVEMLSRDLDNRDFSIIEEITLGPIDVITRTDEGRLIQESEKQIISEVLIQTPERPQRHVIPEVLAQTPERPSVEPMITQQQLVPEDSERQVVPELLPQMPERSIIEPMITEPQPKPAVGSEEKITATPGISVRLPSSPSMQPKQPETYVILQPDTRSERVETRLSPSADELPRIRDLLQQESSMNRKVPKRIRKKKILYSNKVLRGKIDRRIKPLHYVSYSDRLMLPFDQSVEFNEPFDDYDAELKPIDCYRVPFYELPPDYDFFAELFCDLFENDLDITAEESTYDLELNELRASIAAPDTFLKVLRLSRRKSSRGEDPSKKSFLLVDQKRQSSWREVPPIVIPPQIYDLTLNLPNLGETLIQTSRQEQENFILPPAITIAPDIPANVSTTENRPIQEIAPIQEKEVQPESILGQRKRPRTRREKVVSMTEIVSETEQRPPEQLQSSSLQITEPATVTVPVMVVPQEEEFVEIPEPNRRKTVCFQNVLNKLDILWSEKSELVTFCDLCPTEIVNKFTAASTFSALLCLHAIKIVSLQQDPQQWSPESLKIFRH